MATLICVHRVDDVQRWLDSRRRDELFAPLGITARAFADAGGSDWTGLIMDVPDLSAWQRAKRSAAGLRAMNRDGLRLDTIIELAEAPNPKQTLLGDVTADLG